MTMRMKMSFREEIYRLRYCITFTDLSNYPIICLTIADLINVRGLALIVSHDISWKMAGIIKKHLFLLTNPLLVK